jgi:hypothetical protein
MIQCTDMKDIKFTLCIFPNLVIVREVKLETRLPIASQLYYKIYFANIYCKRYKQTAYVNRWGMATVVKLFVEMRCQIYHMRYTKFHWSEVSLLRSNFHSIGSSKFLFFSPNNCRGNTGSGFKDGRRE